MKLTKMAMVPALICCLWVPGLMAEDSDKKTEEVPSITETVEVVGSVPLNRSVQSITVYDRNHLRSIGGNGLKEMLDHTPGFLVLNGGHYGQMAYAFARGAAVNQTLFIIDGIKVTDPSNSLGLNLTMLSTRMLERVEIVRGPMGATYGSNAMGGVVSLTTRRDDGVTASAAFGSHGSYEAGIHAARRLENWHLSFNADLVRFNEDLENDTFSNRGITARAMFNRGRIETGIQLFYHSASSGIPWYMGISTPNRNYDQKSFIAALPFSVRFGDDTRVRFCLFHNANEYEFEDPDDAWDPFYGNRSRINDVEASVSGKLSSNLRYRFGGEASFQSILNRSGETNTLNNENTHFLSAFVNADLDLGALMVAAALRMDKYSEVKTAWSPQVGASWLISDSVKLRASYGESFRAPTLPERLNPYWGNPDLEPEGSRSLDTGIEVFLKRLTLGVTWFDTSYRNLIGFSPITYAFTNLNRATIRGLEINASLRPVDPLELTAAWTWMDTNDLQYERQLLRRPKHALSAGIHWKHTRFSLSGEMVYVGRRLDYNELDWLSPIAESPSFNTFSFQVRVPLSDSLALHARITNAFNAEYEEVFGYPAPGTRIMAGLRFTSE